MDVLAIRAGRAFDGERMRPGPVTVLMAGDRIVDVTSGWPHLPDGCESVDAPGTCVLPGFVDAHVHLCGDGEPGALERLAGVDPDTLGGVVEASLRAHLAVGVTTVRDLGDRSGAVLDWRSRAAATGAAADFPTVVASGPPLTSVGGHCWMLGGEAAGVEALRAAVRDRVGRGADVVKVMASGGAMTPGTDLAACQFTLDELCAVVDEAHTAGSAVTVHAHALEAVEQAVAAGADGIEHCSCVTAAGMESPVELFDRIAAAGAVVCPTLGRNVAAGPPPAVAALFQRYGMTWEARQRLVGAMHRRGVRIASGTDGGINPGKPHGLLVTALDNLVAGGVSPMDALASATSVAADAVGLGHRKGRLGAGYDADVVLVDGDPSAHVLALRDIDAVVLGGRLSRLRPPARRGTPAT